MKKLIITISLVLGVTFALLFVMHFCSNADELPSESTTIEETTENTEAEVPTTEEEEFNLYEYIKEKIVPVVVGVLTATSALLATLAAIKRSLNSISEAREGIKKEAQARDAKTEKRLEAMEKQVDKLTNAVERIEESTKGVPVFESQIDNLSKVCSGTAKILTLAYSANPDIVKSGKGKKMQLLLNEIAEKGDGESETEN
ncbi:MAG: hypothetical protein J6A96_00900 [Clostridia bacterium]|nr:hypothetical protein [Clostridia bacterium]